MVEKSRDIHINIEGGNSEALQIVELPVYLNRGIHFFHPLEKLSLKRGEETQIAVKTYPRSEVSGWVNYRVKYSVSTPYWETMSDEKGCCQVSLRVPNKKATEGELVICIKPNRNSSNFFNIDCNLE